MKMKIYNQKPTMLFISGLLIFLCISITQAQELPSPWVSTDIGSVLTAGSATFENDIYTIKASGSDIWGTEDELHYMYQPAVGDCDITASVEYVTGGSSDSKACLMIRETLDANSAFAMAVTCYGPNHGTYMQFRSIAGSNCGHNNLNHHQPAPVWLKLVREGNTFTANYSIDEGVTWLKDNTDPNTTDITMTADTVYIGLGLCNKAGDALGEVTFANVIVNPGIEYTGIKQLTTNSLSVYPNLVADFLTIEINEKVFDGNSQISIINNLGQLVHKVEATRNRHLIDLSELPQGMYFISLKTEQGNVVKRIIKK
jgi:hypothetical protein